MIPTAMQQRLEWKPVKGAVFRQLTQFKVLLDVYCLVTGKRYERVVNERTEAGFACTQCSKGRFHLRIQRTSATGDRWIMKTVKICSCGAPPALVEDLKSNDLTKLVGKKVSPKSVWKPLANACFPYGYIRDKSQSSRRWSIHCKRPTCSGEIKTELDYVRGGGKYDAFRIVAAVNCSQACREDGNESIPISTKPPEDDDLSCPLCFEEEPMFSVEFPCGKRTCRDCFQKLVETCPSEMLKRKGLWRFDPDRDDTPCHHCPFCKDAYTPRTKMQLHERDKADAASEVKVRELVHIPYAYQSFDDEMQAHVPTQADFVAANEQYVAYLDRMEQEALEASAVPQPEMWSLLDGSTNADFERLAALAQTDLYQRHRHAVLNFLEAVEDLYDHALDNGLLQRVANANGEDERRLLMQSAYVNGWGGDGAIDPRLVINLLQRKQLLQVIDLVSDNDDDDGDSDDSIDADESYRDSNSETASV